MEWLWVAKARLAAGDVPGARAILEECLRELPETAAGRWGMHLVARAEGDEEAAARWRAEALAREPRIADT